MHKRLLVVLAILSTATAVAAVRVFTRVSLPPSQEEISEMVKVSAHRGADAINGLHSEKIPTQIGGSGGRLGELLLSPPGSLSQQRASIQENVREAVELLKTDARSGDKSLLAEIGALPRNCRGCAEFFSQIRAAYSSEELTSDERIYLSSALAASGREDNQKFLYDQFRRAATDPGAALVPPTTLARQLERNQQGGPLAGDVVEQVTSDLQSENPYIRDAAISLLTKQHSLQAAQSLYEYTVNSSERDGFYRQGMGLGLMTPAPDAFPYLDDLVRKQDQYSHLALKALLNAGSEGISRAVSLLQELQGSEPNRSLIQGAVDHIPMYGPSLAYMRSLQGSSNPTVAELAREVLREHESREAALKKGIEYNDNYAAGIIMPTPGPF